MCDPAADSEISPLHRKSTAIACASGFLAHCFFIFLFAFIGAKSLAWLNVGSVLIWAAAFCLYRRNAFNAATWLMLFELLLHAIVTTRLLGTAAGFQYFLWPATGLAMILVDVRLRYSSLFSATPILVLVGLETLYADVIYPFQYVDYLWVLRTLNIAIAGVPLVLVSLSLRSIGETQQRRLTRQASYDDLTGLWNRRHGRLALEQSKGLAERNGLAFCIVLADIDHFKHFNDTYGHDIGDIVLKRVAELFLARLRTSDIVCRWGGEEFLIIMSGSGLVNSVGVTEGLRINLKHLRIPGQRDIQGIPTSFGVAEFTPGESIGQLLNRADKLLYRAKSEGRNRVVAQDAHTATSALPYAANAPSSRENSNP